MAEPPIDEGWAWAVMIGGFIITFWVLGLERVSGVLFLEAIQYFDASSTATSMMFFIQYASSVVTSVLFGLLSTKCDTRSFCIFGGLSLSLAFTLQKLTPNVQVFVVTIGVFWGIGHACSFLCVPTVLCYYFHHKLGIANGLAYLGGSCGTLVMPLFLEFLLQQYGFRGTMLIIGGCALNMCMASLLFRPTSFYTHAAILDSLTCESSPTPLVNSVSTVEKQSLATSKLPRKNRINPSRQVYVVTQPKHQTDTKASPNASTNEILSASYQHSTTGEAGVKLEIKLPSSTSEEQINGNSRKKKASTRGAYSALCSSLSFQLSCLGRILSLVHLVSCTILLPSYAINNGLSSSTIAVMLMVAGACTLVSTPFHGFMASLQSVDASLYYGSVTLGGASIVLFCIWWPSYTSFLMMTISLGAFQSVLACLMGVTLAECVGNELLPVALSINVYSFYMVMMLMPTLYGYIFDTMGSYDIPMIIAGVLGAVGGLVIILEKLLRGKHFSNLLMK